MQGKVPPESSATNRVYVGIDVCKDRLDVYLHPLGQSFQAANTAEGLKALKRRIAKLEIVSIVMEATGKYHRLAHRTLHAAGFAVALVNPLRSRLFAQAAGQFAKTDRLDARILALFGEGLEPGAVAPAAADVEALQELVQARNAAVAEMTALTNRQAASQTSFLKAELSRRRKATQTHIDRLDSEIARRIAADPGLSRRHEIARSIPGVGPVAALGLAIGMPELGACTAKAASLLAGLAPLACDSGRTTGERHIRGGRGHVRTSLYFAAIAAARFNPDLAPFYKRLREAGKKPKVAITAVMRKLVVLANSLFRENRIWSPTPP